MSWPFCIRDRFSIVIALLDNGTRARTAAIRQLAQLIWPLNPNATWFLEVARKTAAGGHQRAFATC